jgi:hypothetical protein
MDKLLKFLLKNINLVVFKSTPGLLPIFALATLDSKQFVTASLIFTTVTAFSGFMGEALNSLLAKSFNYKLSIKSSYFNLVSFVSLVVFLLSFIGYVIFYSIDSAPWHVSIFILMLALINIIIPSGASVFFNNCKSFNLLVTSFIFYFFSLASFIIISRIYKNFFSVLLYGIVLCIFLQFFLMNYFKNPHPYVKTNLLTNDVKAYLNFLPSYMITGPIHGFCLILFSKFSINGYQELAQLTSFYPIAMAISFLASIYSPVLIQELSSIKFKAKAHVSYILFFMLVSAILASLFFYLLSPIINSYFDMRLGQHLNLMPFIILIGFSMSINLVTSAYLISYFNLKYLLFTSIIYSSVYLVGTILTIIYDLGIKAICISQITAFLIMLLIQLFVIKRKILLNSCLKF